MINSITLWDEGPDTHLGTLLYDDDTQLAHLADFEEQSYKSLKHCLSDMIMPFLIEIDAILFMYDHAEDPLTAYDVYLNERISFEVRGSAEFKHAVFHYINHLSRLINNTSSKKDVPVFADEKGYGIRELQHIFSEKNLEQFGDFTVEENGAEFYFKITDDKMISFIEGLTYASDSYLFEIFQENTADGPFFRFKIYDYDKHLANINNFGKADIDLTIGDDQEHFNVLFNKYREIAEFLERLSNQKKEKTYGHHTSKSLTLLEDYKAIHDGFHKYTAIEVDVKCFTNKPEEIPEEFFQTETGEHIIQAAYESWWDMIIHYLKTEFQHKDWIEDVYQVGRSGGYVQVFFDVDYDTTDSNDFLFDEDTVTGEVYGIEHYETLDELFPVLEDTINYIEGEKKYFEERGYKEYVLEEYNYYKEEERDNTRTA